MLDPSTELGLLEPLPARDGPVVLPPPPPLETGSEVALTALWVCELPAGTIWSSCVPADVALSDGTVDLWSQVARELGSHGWNVEARTQYPGSAADGERDPLFSALRSWMSETRSVPSKLTSAMTEQPTEPGWWEWLMWRPDRIARPGAIHLEHTASKERGEMVLPDGTVGWLRIDVHAPANPIVPLEVAIAGAPR